MNYLFLFFIVTNFFSCQLPLDMQTKIANLIFCQKEPNIVPLKKHLDNYEGLVFPSTGSFVFVKSMSDQTESDEYLMSLKPNDTVLPHIQLWFCYDIFRIDDDLKKNQNMFSNQMRIRQRNRIFFDKNDTFVLLATKRQHDFKITIRSILKTQSIIINEYFCKNFYSPCLHHDSDCIEYSFFAQEDNSFYLHRRKFFYHFFQKFYTIKEKKHLFFKNFILLRKKKHLLNHVFLTLKSMNILEKIHF